MGGTPPDSPPGPDSSLSNEFSKAGFGPFTNPSSWSDLPNDILLSILQRLELPQALALASVCATWRAAATTAGVPHPSTPWILSWGNLLEKKQEHNNRCSPAGTCNLYNPVDVDKSYSVSFPKDCFVTCRGASHGWLILVNSRSSLVLYNPVTLARITLPAVYSSSEEGDLEHCCCMETEGAVHHCSRIWLYQKAVLSCSPSKGSGYVVMIIHRDNKCLSFVKAGQKKWQVASTLSGGDQYLDCVYHRGSFYTVTLREMVEKWDLDDGEDGATRRQVVVAAPSSLPGRVITRHLVSTPWGELLQVRAGLDPWHSPDGIEFRICKVDPDARKKMVVVQENDFFSRAGLDPVQENDGLTLMDHHALFLGLNHSACLPTRNLRGIRPRCIYYSAPGMTMHAVNFLSRLPVWGGVRRYDLETRKFERAIPFCDVEERIYGIIPSEVWITRNL